MSLLRAVEIVQPDYQWQYQLRHERDVTAQVPLLMLQNLNVKLIAVPSDGSCQSFGTFCHTSHTLGFDRSHRK